jgi:anti-sigma regulatory factor (Ser/Thr protein kinase)
MRNISEHVLDIIQNSVRAGATLIEIIVEENKSSDLYALTIKDNGCGMCREILEKAANPFFTSRKTRKVGLGLSLLRQNAEAANGSFFIESSVGVGTEVKAIFQLTHLDRPPVGDIWNSWYLTIIGNPDIRIIYRHQTHEGVFEIDSGEIREMMKGISLQQAQIGHAITEMIKNNLEEIKASK